MLLHLVNKRLLGKGNSNSHSARPVHLIITMIKWIRTSRLSIKNLVEEAEEVDRVLLHPGARHLW